MLEESNLPPIIPQGSFFILANTDAVDQNRYMKSENEDGTGFEETNLRDWKFARWLTKEIGVACIPPSPFYAKEHKHMVQNLARFCFCKEIFFFFDKK